MVEPVSPTGQVHFGSSVTAEDEVGVRYDVRLVGEDEADIHAGLISYVSPLAKALMGARIGDEVVWQRPAGPMRLEVLSIDGIGD